MKKTFLKLILISVLIAFTLNSCKRGNVDIIEVTAEIENCSLPYIVNFEVDLTYQGNDIEYLWEFGDGTTSNDKNPVHIYTTVGAYVVTLKVNNYDATKEETITVDIHTESIPVISDYDYEVIYNTYAPAEIKFLNFSEHSDNFFWNFDDGLGTDDFETSHIFEEADTFNVSLRAVCNGDTAIHTETIKILPPPLNIYIKRVSVWLPTEHINKELELKIWYGIFDETPITLQNIVATSIPVSWNMYDELYFFDGIYDSELLKFEIRDDNNFSNVIYTFAITTYDISQTHYNTILTWDDGNGYSAEVVLEYID
jgi:PKD repeat protein